MMHDFTGYMTINGKDAWTEYSAFLCEDKPEDNFNFGELQKPLEMKEYTAVDFRERNGEELPEELPSPCYKARDVTLYIALYAGSMAEYEQRRSVFMEAIREGWQEFRVKELAGTFRFYYKGISDAKLLQDKMDNRVFGCLKMKFREPKPGALTGI